MPLFLLDKIKLRAINDFDPKQMSTREKTELNYILERTRVIEQIGRDYILDHDEDCQHQFERFEMRNHGDDEYSRDIISDDENSVNLKEFGPSRHVKGINPEEELKALKVKVCSRREGQFAIGHQKEVTTLEELKNMAQKECIREQNDLQYTCHFEDHYYSEKGNPPAAVSEFELHFQSEKESARKEDWELVSCRLDESDDSDDEVELYAAALAFKRGDKMEAIPPENCR